MNEQSPGERFNTWDMVERSAEDTNPPVASSDPLARDVAVEAALVDETPMDETVDTVDPMGEPIVHNAPMAEAMPDETPVDEPVAGESGVSKSIPDIAPMAGMITPEAPVGTSAGSSAPLLDRGDSERLRARWNEIQGTFVDEPRSAVQQADALVSEVVEEITQMFATEHSALESQWKQDSDVSTEDLRKALQRYRSFFNRLVV